MCDINNFFFYSEYISHVTSSSIYYLHGVIRKPSLWSWIWIETYCGFKHKTDNLCILKPTVTNRFCWASDGQLSYVAYSCKFFSDISFPSVAVMLLQIFQYEYFSIIFNAQKSLFLFPSTNTDNIHLIGTNVCDKNGCC
jgi:hypothetical protein